MNAQKVNFGAAPAQKVSFQGLPMKKEVRFEGNQQPKVSFGNQQDQFIKTASLPELKQPVAFGNAGAIQMPQLQPQAKPVVAFGNNPVPVVKQPVAFGNLPNQQTMDLQTLMASPQGQALMAELNKPVVGQNPFSTAPMTAPGQVMLQ